MKALFVTVLVISLIVSIATIGGTVDKPLVLYFSFDGGDAKDSSPNKNDGDIEGAKSVDGHAGKALEFGGIGDYVEISNNDSINPDQELTVEAWVYINKQPAGDGWSAMVGKNPYPNGYLTWFEDESLNPCGLIYVAGTRYDCRASINLTEKTWYHIAYTVAQGEMNYYVDGEVTKTANIPKGKLDVTANPLRVGGQGGGSGFDGIIDEVAVYSAALTQAEIQQDMENGVMSTDVSPGGKLTTTWGNLKHHTN